MNHVLLVSGRLVSYWNDFLFSHKCSSPHTIAVADPGFPQRWGRQTSRGRPHTIWINIPKKLHEIERMRPP